MEFSRVRDAAAAGSRDWSSDAPRLELTVLNGTAERRTYALTASPRIDIGRCAEVRDSRHRLIRTNHVAFLERSGEVNQSVSRRHAHISYDPPSGASGCTMTAANMGPVSCGRDGVSRSRGDHAASAWNPPTRSFSATRACGSSLVARATDPRRSERSLSEIPVQPLDRGADLRRRHDTHEAIDG